MDTLKLPERLFRSGSVVALRTADDTGGGDAGEDDRRVTLSFSSEAEVARWWGIEILGHDPAEVDLSRFRAGVMPLLCDHRNSIDSQVGIVESVTIENGRGLAVVRLGKGVRASETLERIRDGELTAVSVGYRINRAVRVGERDGNPIFRATDWTPLEVSLCAVPADETVGVGRSAGLAEIEIPLLSDMKDPRMEHETAPAAGEVRTAAPAAPAAPAPAPTDATAAERARMREIVAIARAFDLPAAMADKAIDAGTGVDAFRKSVLDHLSSGDATAIRHNAAAVGLSDREARSYSLVKAIRYLADPNDRQARREAGFEIEVSEAAAARSHKAPQGLLIPSDVLGRTDFAPLPPRGARAADLTVGTASEGGNLVATSLLSGSFIDLLRAQSAIMRAGVTMLTGLVGNLAIPKQTGGATAYWVGEDTAPSQSGASFGQVPLTPHTVGAFTEISRKLTIQSSLDVEALVRMDLSRVLALAVDSVGLNGSADTDAPNGLKDMAGINVVDFAAAGAPTYAETIQMWRKVAEDNAAVGNLGYLLSPAIVEHLMTTPKFAGGETPIMAAQDRLNGYRAEWSSQVAPAEMWFGNWSDFVAGFWSGLDLTVDPYSASTTGAVRVIAFQDVDFAVRHAESFCDGVAIP